jgi:ubiquinol-cytochrome c reductase iron-sulfur subunit
MTTTASSETSAADLRAKLNSDPRIKGATKHPKRAERVVALSFIVSFLATVGLGIAYWFGDQVQLEAILLGLSLGAAGFGMAAWGKYLMPQGPFLEEREPMETTEHDKEVFAAALSRGGVIMERRGFLAKLMGLAMTAIGIFFIFPLRSLGPQPKDQLFTTKWRAGSRVVTASGRPVTVDDLEVGGVMTVFPEGDAGSAISQTLLLRAGTQDIVTMPGRETWGPQGYLAYSKICTHAGCPVGLYEEQAQQLLCPCHQSLFNVLDGAMPIFGPAPRPLPQLPLMVDDNGYIRAQQGYDQPVGPSFWERNS